MLINIIGFWLLIVAASCVLVYFALPAETRRYARGTLIFGLGLGTWTLFFFVVGGVHD